MNNDLSFWRKLILDFTDEPKTDADIAYLYRNIARPEIPVSALWDAEKGARRRANTEMYLKNGMGTRDFREIALKNRGWAIGQKDTDMPYKTPTGAIMEQILNPDKIIVPDKDKMGNIWE